MSEILEVCFTSSFEYKWAGMERASAIVLYAELHWYVSYD